MAAQELSPGSQTLFGNPCCRKLRFVAVEALGKQSFRRFPKPANDVPNMGQPDLSKNRPKLPNTGKAARAASPPCLMCATTPRPPKRFGGRTTMRSPTWPPHLGGDGGGYRDYVARWHCHSFATHKLLLIHKLRLPSNSATVALLLGTVTPANATRLSPGTVAMRPKTEVRSFKSTVPRFLQHDQDGQRAFSRDSYAGPPAPKTWQNWQTQLFSCSKALVAMGLR
jgi:hypothetical protein